MFKVFLITVRIFLSLNLNKKNYYIKFSKFYFIAFLDSNIKNFIYITIVKRILIVFIYKSISNHEIKNSVWTYKIYKS